MSEEDPSREAAAPIGAAQTEVPRAGGEGVAAAGGPPGARSLREGPAGRGPGADSPSEGPATMATEAGEHPATTPARPTPDTWVGRVIDERYEVLESLGQGGMGMVFVAEHLKLRTKVALKTITPALAGNDMVAMRFAREAMASAQLSHPNVARAMDFGSLPEGGAYLVLELVEGPSLTSRIESQEMLWPEVCEIAAQIADALAAAHGMGIVHRDLKPDNVLLEARHDGPMIAKVLDFGIARVRTDSSAPPGPDGANTDKPITRAGTIMGTPGYMAPEQAMGDEVDHRADLYALGAILWEMLVGEPLYDGDDFSAIIKAQLAREVPSVRKETGDRQIPLELDRLITALLAYSRDERPASTAEVRDTLRRLPMERSSSASIKIVTDTVTEAIRDAAPQLREQAARVRETRVDRRVWIGAGLAALVLFPLVLAGLGGDESPPSVEENEPEAPPAPPEISLVASPHVDTIVAGRVRRDRREAARWLDEHRADEGVPAFAVLLAELELGRGCAPRSETLARIRELGDARVLPAIAYWEGRPERGCGPLRMRDCIGCIRDDLAATREALSAEAR